MRLSEKLAKADHKTTQLTLRVKTDVAAQLKKDAEGTETTVNELASRLLETALELPAWTNAAVLLVKVQAREVVPQLRQELLERVRSVARNAGADPELIREGDLDVAPSVTEVHVSPHGGTIDIAGAVAVPLGGHPDFDVIRGDYSAVVVLRGASVQLTKLASSLKPESQFEDLPF